MLSAIMRLQNSASDAMAPAFFWAYDEMPEGEEKKSVKDLMTVQSFSLLTAEHLLKHGMIKLGDGRTNTDAALFEACTNNNFGTSKFGLTVLDLAHPAIPAAMLETMFNSAETTTIAKRALTANPNFPKSIKITPAMRRHRALALAKYGDLTNPEVVAELAREVADQAVEGGDDLYRARFSLCERKNLPEVLAAQLSWTADHTTFSLLAQTAGHREMMRKKLSGQEISGPPPIAIYTRSEVFYLTPDMDAKILTAIYEDLQTPETQDTNPHWREFMARAASHPNAPISLLADAIQNDEVVGLLEKSLLTMNSPLAETTLLSLRTRGARPEYASFAKINCSSSTLAKMFDACCQEKTEVFAASDTPEREILNEDCLALASHPNFPWEKYSYGKMISSVGAPELGVLTCAMALNAKYPEVETLHETAWPASALFNPKTSAFRLEKIAAQHKELAVLASMHPNGLSLAPLAHDDRETADLLREQLPKPILTGKSSHRPYSDKTSAIII